VGELGWNWAPDVKALQDRLHEMKLLGDADYATESGRAIGYLSIAAGDLTATIAAIRTLRETLLGDAAPAVARIEPQHPRVGALSNPLTVTGTPESSALK